MLYILKKPVNEIQEVKSVRSPNRKASDLEAE